MNYLYLLAECALVFTLLIFFYKNGKKEGLFIFISFMSALLGVVMFKIVDILSFPISYGLPIVMGIFMANNVIIQRFGLDEVKKIIYTFSISYIVPLALVCLCSLVTSSEYDLVTNKAFNGIFGYDFINIRCFVGALLSIGFMIWYNGEVYYYIRKNRNNLVFSNIGSILVIQFIESVIFVIIAYSGMFDVVMLFGMIVIRYLVKVVIGIFGLIPVILINKRKGM